MGDLGSHPELQQLRTDLEQAATLEHQDHARRTRGLAAVEVATGPMAELRRQVRERAERDLLGYYAAADALYAEAAQEPVRRSEVRQMAHGHPAGETCARCAPADDGGTTDLTGHLEQDGEQPDVGRAVRSLLRWWRGLGKPQQARLMDLRRQVEDRAAAEGISVQEAAERTAAEMRADAQPLGAGMVGRLTLLEDSEPTVTRIGPGLLMLSLELRPVDVHALMAHEQREPVRSLTMPAAPVVEVVAAAMSPAAAAGLLRGVADDLDPPRMLVGGDGPRLLAADELADVDVRVLHARERIGQLKAIIAAWWADPGNQETIDALAAVAREVRPDLFDTDQPGEARGIDLGPTSLDTG